MLFTNVFIIRFWNSTSRASPEQNAFNQSVISSLLNLTPWATLSLDISTSVSLFCVSSRLSFSLILSIASLFSVLIKAETAASISLLILLSSFSNSFTFLDEYSVCYYSTILSAIYSILFGWRTYSTVWLTTNHSMKPFFSLFFWQVSPSLFLFFLVKQV